MNINKDKRVISILENLKNNESLEYFFGISYFGYTTLFIKLFIKKRNRMICLECEKEIPQDEEVDLWICQLCVDKFNLNRLWEEHDLGLIDALDFNKNKSFREKYKLKR
jgi:hypothetical protein